VGVPIEDLGTCCYVTSSVNSVRLAERPTTNEQVGTWTKDRTGGPRRSTTGRRLRHIWPALRRNLIFNLRTVGHMRLLKRRAGSQAAASWRAGRMPS